MMFIINKFECCMDIAAVSDAFTLGWCQQFCHLLSTCICDRLTVTTSEVDLL